MKRHIQEKLAAWYDSKKRKPLILRGARQVGKSTLVRLFAEEKKLNLVEINLEQNHQLNKVFETNDCEQILLELQGLSQSKLKSPDTLLFLDEIQSTPAALPSLRYLYEETDIPIIAAGSLLEFLLSEHNFSMPVGRIEYLHLGPMSFSEYLLACEDHYLFNIIANQDINQITVESNHKNFLKRYFEYLFTGGMPEAILSSIESKDINAARQVHRSIVQTYQDDFHKYSNKNEFMKINMVFDKIPRIIGKKLKYSNISRDERAIEIRKILTLLMHARLVTPAYHTHASSIPLAAQVEEKIVKLFFIDIGLLNYLNKLDWSDINGINSLLNFSFMAEQFVAQHLSSREEGYEKPALFYWLREGKKGNAEVDFLVSSSNLIIPVEVKSGKSGALKSLHQFNLARHNKFAARFDLNLYSKQTVKNIHDKNHEFQLISLPIYCAEWLNTSCIQSTLTFPG